MFFFFFFSFSSYAPGALSTAPNIDIIVEREEREREGGIEFGTGAPFVTQNIILKFFEKKKKEKNMIILLKAMK